MSTEAVPGPGVRWIGAQRDVLGGDLRGHAEIEVLSSVPYLYGLGPLEGLAREAGLDPERPLPFRVRATAVEATLHVLDKRDGLAHNPERHEQAKVRRTLEDAPVELVGLCADRVALLHEGRLARLGAPDEVITRQSLREVYGVEVTVMEVTGADGRGTRVCVPAVGATGRGAPPGRTS